MESTKLTNYKAPSNQPTPKARKGYAGISLDKGDSYRSGVEQDNAKALFFYRISANWINRDAKKEAEDKINELLFEQPSLSDEEQEKAFQIWWPAAEDGHAEARYQLGWMYINGDYVQKNETKGMEYIKLAADNKHPEAMVTLGDYNKWQNKLGDALFYYEGASQAGIGKASYEAAMLSEREDDAINYLQLAYKQGETRNGEVAFQLYIKYSARANSIDVKDALYAEEWLAIAVTEGHPKAKEISEKPDDPGLLRL